MGPDRVVQPGGVLGVVLAVDQHQRGPLVVLDDVGHAVEILQNRAHVSGVEPPSAALLKSSGGELSDKDEAFMVPSWRRTPTNRSYLDISERFLLINKKSIKSFTFLSDGKKEKDNIPSFPTIFSLESHKK